MEKLLRAQHRERDNSISGQKFLNGVYLVESEVKAVKVLVTEIQ
jgi:hypothetical protein